MVGKSGGYHGTILKIFHGSKQGYPLLTKILNIVMDAVMHHYVTVVVEEEAGPEGLGQLIQRPK